MPIPDQLAILSNELALTVLALAVFAAGLLTKDKSGRTEAVLAATGLLGLMILGWAGMMPEGAAFGGAVANNAATFFFKQLFLAAALLTVLLAWPDQNARRPGMPAGKAGEYLGLLLCSVLGMCLLVSAQELVFIYVSLELITLPLVALVALDHRDPRGPEAGLKYVLFSALSSGLLLFGLSYLYGLTGSTYLTEVALLLPGSAMTWMALGFVTAGVGFKIAAVPFHSWSPDTYEGAPMPVATFLSVGSKAAGFVLFYKLIAGLFGPSTGAISHLAALLSVLTMTFGNLVALHQTNVKRFLAYSSIAQAGYLLIGLVDGGVTGHAAVYYYLLVYLFSNVSAFAVVSIISSQTGKEDIRDYAGLSRSNPLLARVLMLAMFSLAGIPPLAGFLGKFYLFAAAARDGWYWLVFAGAINATISLYYYLIVVKWSFLMVPGPGEGITRPIAFGWPSRLAVAIAAFGMVVAGLLPPIVAWAEAAARAGGL